eukprot:SAG11_NODE_1068_length_5979_cov_9.282653_5_plen_82_part_00
MLSRLNEETDAELYSFSKFCARIKAIDYALNGNRAKRKAGFNQLRSDVKKGAKAEEEVDLSTLSGEALKRKLQSMANKRAH